MIACLRRRLTATAPLVVSLAAGALAPPALGVARPLAVSWTRGWPSPGTPVRYDRVGVIKVGSPRAHNVLVLEPGTSAGAAYFVPLARWIAARSPRWQVWAIQRRETLLQDESELGLAKAGRANATQLFDYYLGWLKAPGVARHFKFIPNSSVAFAKRWGMSVAVHDLRVVIDAARRLRGHVVLGGHSLGGAVVTAYASWDFGGHPGADGLAGLVYIDGGSFGPESTASARRALTALARPSASPWLAFGGIAAPFAGLYNATGSEAALLDPNGPSLGQESGLLNGLGLTPSVPVTNLGQYGYALNVATSPLVLIAAQAHLGRGLALTGSPPYGWDGGGALTPIMRFASMFAGAGVNGADGTEWYFPARLTIDSQAIDNGISDGAQRALGLRATLARRLPRSLRILAFGAALTGPHRLLMRATQALARRSHIPRRNLTLVNDPSYAHNDPAGAYPRNAFLAHLIGFLRAVSRR